MAISKKEDKYGWWATPTKLYPREKKPAFTVCWCVVCKSAWEIERYGYLKQKKILRHEDFPSIGLKRKICNDCKNEHTRRKQNETKEEITKRI